MAPAVTVLGTGGWGTAIALVAAENGHRITLWGRDAGNVRRIARDRENRRFLPGVPLPSAIQVVSEAAALEASELIISAVPTAWLETTLSPLAGHLPRDRPILSLTKGISGEDLTRPSETLGRVFPANEIAVLSGPSHAEEVARGIPTSVVLAAAREETARSLQDRLATERFRIYTNRDLIGVELAGALKNVLAIAAGVGDGLGFGDNTKAALVTRGLAEMARLGGTLGAQRETFAGLAGMGDLVTSAFSRHGRNRAVGERIGRGEKLAEIQASTPSVAEGVHTARAVPELVRKCGVEMPIAAEVHAMLFEGKDPEAALRSLLRRRSKAETH